MRKQRILIVDDSPLIRRILSDWIQAEFDLELVGAAENGHEAIRLAEELKPDLITLDVEMPECDGITALRAIMAARPTAVLMISSVTTKGAKSTLAAMEAGAYDFVTKPGGASSVKFGCTKEEVLNKIRAGRYVRVGSPTTLKVTEKPAAVSIPSRSDKVVVIASSTGGPQALVRLWPNIPANFPAPILIVQHMPAGFTDSFAKRLTKLGTVPCVEAKAGMTPEPGVAILAPGGYHMTLDADGKIALDARPTIHGVRPAADFLFETAAARFGSRLIGLVLTGMGKDGAAGALQIKNSGGVVLGESADSCLVYGMPRAAMELGAVSAEASIDDLMSHVAGCLTKRGQNAA
ncbi:MAG: chemotaxis response regulator protein-glutamate methylesterase [Chthonomonas sp.]|nr:chemotaxis response regulator protein-glutamate methylesterase [Chthonomonas sp.]